MEKNNNRRLRNSVVVGFTLLSVILIFNIWFDHLVGTEAEQPRYVRATFSMPTPQGFDLTLTAQPTTGGGQGGGHGDEHDRVLTPSPTFDLTNWATEDVSDDLRDE